MAKRETAPLPGLYKNGARWWVRTVRAPLLSAAKSLSTGTDATARANAVLGMVRTMEDNPTQYAWLSLAHSGAVTLADLYNHFAAGTLDVLRDMVQKAEHAKADTDLRPAVKDFAEYLQRLPISDKSKLDYENQVRFFIPDTAPFPKSRLTADYVQKRLGALTGSRTDRAAPASGSTKRRYLVALQQFTRWAYPRELIDALPLAGAFGKGGWAPKNGSARSTFYEFADVQKILDHVARQDDRAALALMFGSGIELGALSALAGRDLNAAERTVIAHGTKNVHREDRTIFVDKWAWEVFYEYARYVIGTGPIFHRTAKQLRTAFYWAQVRAGLIAEPPVIEATGKRQWSAVKPHTLHDCRHSYCIIRALGQDGEEPRDTLYLSAQLGHADEQMITRVYKKANLRQRLALIRSQAKAAAAAREA
jgi:integrase